MLTDIYRSAVSTDLGVTLQGGDEWGDYYLDLDQLFQQGIIMANSDLKRSSVKANVSRKFSEEFTIRVNANYIKSIKRSYSARIEYFGIAPRQLSNASRFQQRSVS